MESRARILVTVLFVEARVRMYGCKARSGIPEIVSAKNFFGVVSRDRYVVPFSMSRVTSHPGNVAEPPHRCPQKRQEGVHGNRQVPADFTKSSMWAPRRIRAPSIVTVHMLFSNSTVAHPSFARKALMVVCQTLAVEGMP